MPDRHPQLCPPVLSMAMPGNFIPTGSWGMSAHSWAWEHPRGGSQSWVGGREGIGGRKLGEKVRHAINKLASGERNVSVRQQRHTNARDGEGNVVVWGIKSMEIGAGMTGEEAFPESGGSKRGYGAAQVVIGSVDEARWDWGSHQSQGSQPLSTLKIVLLLSDRENRLGLRLSSCSAPRTIFSEGR